MSIHPLAGHAVPASMLTDIRSLSDSYYNLRPDPENPAEKISFGTSGHRGTSTDRSFNEAHILAVSQAVCEYRVAAGIRGPLFVGKDTHALSDAAFRTAVEVLAANDVEVRYEDGYTPTPVVSHAILLHNRSDSEALADGIIITPSHNPPEYGGFKYNPPSGGPAGAVVTSAIEARANEILSLGNADVKRRPFPKAMKLPNVRAFDFLRPYVDTLGEVLDMEAISKAGLRIGADPMGGAGVGYWGPIADTYGLNLTVVNERVDPTFSFMSIDRDGKIRMDCSSPYAMAGLIELRESYDLAFG
ncbi:MAG: alpha-D-glucose phosphate-specific phosphoglucomutase, partial [Bacteroidetes bacterium]|nr:alpha-D-glucose phosphate-specific phosphoglucomutase [Bacteroidota bacterium]